jgi:hypothetical protein
MNAGIDFKNINAAALRNGRSLVQDLMPGGKFRSLEYVVKNPCRNDGRPGSFTINYRDGVWKDFATDDGGSDFISLVAYLKGVNQGDAARELAERLAVPILKPTGHASNGHTNGRTNGYIGTPIKKAPATERRRFSSGATKGLLRRPMNYAATFIYLTIYQSGSRSNRIPVVSRTGIGRSLIARRSAGRRRSRMTMLPSRIEARQSILSIRSSSATKFSGRKASGMLIH